MNSRAYNAPYRTEIQPSSTDKCNLTEPTIFPIYGSVLKQLRPADFARYMALSARASRIAPVSSPLNWATPKLPVTAFSRGGTSSFDMATHILLTNGFASSNVVLGNISMNSSPPSRATKSVSLHCAFISDATLFNTLSPTG